MFLKKCLKMLGLIIIALLVLIGTTQTKTRADSSVSSAPPNHYNIVFVNDVSGSMTSTDPNNLRYQAIGQFMALSAESGNYFGSVSFNNGVVAQQNLTNLQGMAAKNNFLQTLENTKVGGWTNEGLGIQTAVNMLNSQKDKGLPSIIVMVSDGNTQMNANSSGSDQQAALQTEADAIQQAKNAGYKIYTVCLNAKGTDYPANPTELAQIAQGTGGKTAEINTADDLQKTYNMFYSLIFSTNGQGVGPVVFPPSGVITGSFTVASVGVEEANIALIGNVSDYTLTDATGKTYTKASLAAMTYSSGNYTIIKLLKPQTGVWKYTFKGTPGSKLQINFIDNTNLSAQVTVSPSEKIYKDTDKIKVNAVLMSEEAAVPGAIYKDFNAALAVTDNKNVTQTYTMTAGNQGFDYTLSPLAKGTYTYHVMVKGQGYSLNTDIGTLNIADTPPVKNKDLSTTIYLWPLFSSNQSSVNLTPAASDTQDKNLTYKIQDTSFMSSDYSLSGNTLTIDGSKLLKNPFSLPKGSFTIRAYNQYGAYTDFIVKVKTVNVGFWTMVGIIAGAVVVLGIIGLSTWLAKNRLFNGTCYAKQFDENGDYDEVSRDKPSRGKRYLADFNIKNSDVNMGKSYFKATGKLDAVLVLKAPLYQKGKLVKKIDLNGRGTPVSLSFDKAGTKGITVRFITEKRQKGYNNHSSGF